MSYSAQITEPTTVEDGFVQAAQSVGPFFDEAVDMDVRIKAATDARIVAAYVRRISVVERVIDTELDASDRSRQGLARSSTTTPRLGGYFAARMRRLSPAQLQQLGEHIERMIFAAFAASIFAPGIAEDAWEFEQGPAEDDWDAFLEMLYLPERTGSLDAVMDYAEPHRQALKEFADGVGLTQGIAQFRKRAVVNMNCFFFMSVGESLHSSSI